MFSIGTLLFMLSSVSQAPLVPVLLSQGVASYYTTQENGPVTASGELLSNQGKTCAMRKGKFGDWFLVESLTTGNRVTVRLNDRGPYVKGRVIDLSRGARDALGGWDLGKVRIYRLVGAR